MKKYLLSVDNGGTYIKAALFDVDGNQISIAKEHSSPINLGNGLVEIDQEQLWEKNCRCIAKLLAQSCIQPDEVACVSFAGQGKGLYMVDRDGKCFRNAITSADSRAEPYCRRWIENGLAEKTFPLVYQMPAAGQTVPLLRWLKDHEPDHYSRIGYVFSMKDYLVYRLTGTAIAGKGCQSGTLLVNMITQEYDPKLLEAFGIPEMQDKLPPLMWDTELCGVVSATGARQTGLPEGTPVSAGMFDVDASALGMGVDDPQAMFSIMGTCGINAYISPTPVTNRSVRFNSLYSLPGMYLIEEGSNASSGALEWVIRTLFSEDGDAALYEQIDHAVEQTDPESTNLIFLPFLTGFKHGGSGGSRDSRAAWIGLCPEHGRDEMLRAVYEGAVFSHKLQISHLLENRDKPEQLLVAGGAAGSEVWMQMFADALQLPVEIIDNVEMGVKGLAIASAVAVGMYPDIANAVNRMKRRGRIIQPRPAMAAVYERKFNQFKQVAETIEPVWPVLKKSV